VSETFGDTDCVIVSGVHTTGIYCQPTCTARPHPENVSAYPTHVAAEAAGFRPCLRCRPDRAPAADLTVGVPTSVSHALTLINDGYLDHHGEPALAGRVGYSPRQLRRLFQVHLGASPSFIAGSRRAHFARKLLDDTDLPLTVVARAAGFGGSRQLHRAITSWFGFNPSELRSKRRGRRVAALDGGIPLQLRYPQPFDFTESLGHLAPRAVPGVEVVNGDTYLRTTSTCGRPGVLELAAAEDGTLCLTAHVPTLDSLIDDVARCRRLLGIDLDHTSAVAALEQETLISPLVTQRPGLRAHGSWDRFETAVRIMVGQQVSVAGATTITGRIATKFGSAVELEDEPKLTAIFPTAEQLADADLTGLGMPNKRAETIRRFAQAVATNEVDLHGAGVIDEVTAPFVALPGIGPWTAHMFALRVLGHPDAFPSSDLGLRTAVGHLQGIDRATAAETEAVAQEWRPFRSLAAQHLWASLSSPTPRTD
jgi:AraC family transcriptional regulator, regulatory protein of adaptative response / DNA-3-methyladenine glycosylase II